MFAAKTMSSSVPLGQSMMLFRRCAKVWRRSKATKIADLREEILTTSVEKTQVFPELQ